MNDGITRYVKLISTLLGLTFVASFALCATIAAIIRSVKVEVAFETERIKCIAVDLHQALMLSKGYYSGTYSQREAIFAPLFDMIMVHYKRGLSSHMASRIDSLRDQIITTVVREKPL